MTSNEENKKVDYLVQLDKDVEIVNRLITECIAWEPKSEAEED